MAMPTPCLLCLSWDGTGFVSQLKVMDELGGAGLAHYSFSKSNPLLYGGETEAPEW